MNGNKRYNEGGSMQKTKTRKQSRISSAKAGRSIQHARADYYDYSLVAVIVLLICFWTGYADTVPALTGRTELWR